MKNKKLAIGLALQLAYEYVPCNSEHIEAMYETYSDCGETPPCTYFELEDLTAQALRLKREGCTYEESEKILLL